MPNTALLIVGVDLNILDFGLLVKQKKADAQFRKVKYYLL